MMILANLHLEVFGNTPPRQPQFRLLPRRRRPVCQAGNSIFPFLQKIMFQKVQKRAVVVAQLVERLHPTPEVRSSNPVIGKKIILNVCYQLYWKDENKEKEAGIDPFFKKKSSETNTIK